MESLRSRPRMNIRTQTLQVQNACPSTRNQSYPGGHVHLNNTLAHTWPPVALHPTHSAATCV
jgi:hypothetical protein